MDPGDRERESQILHQVGDVRRYEFPLRRYDGREIWVEDYARVIRDAAGNPLPTNPFRDARVRRALDFPLAGNTVQVDVKDGKIIRKLTYSKTTLEIDGQRVQLLPNSSK